MRFSTLTILLAISSLLGAASVHAETPPRDAPVVATDDHLFKAFGGHDGLVPADIPGVKKEDLDLWVRHNAVNLRGTAHQEEEAKEAQYYRRELSRAEYSRSVRLPAEVNGDQAKARFQDGILELTLPKVAPSSRRTIKVE